MSKLLGGNDGMKLMWGQVLGYGGNGPTKENWRERVSVLFSAQQKKKKFQKVIWCTLVLVRILIQSPHQSMSIPWRASLPSSLYLL